MPSTLSSSTVRRPTRSDHAPRTGLARNWAAAKVRLRRPDREGVGPEFGDDEREDRHQDAHPEQVEEDGQEDEGERTGARAGRLSHGGSRGALGQSRGEDAGVAAGAARDAHGPAMTDQEVREQRPAVLGKQRHQVLFHLLRVVLGGEPEQPGDPADVGVHRDALIPSEGVAEHHVGRLPADPRQGAEGVHRVGNPAAVPRHHLPGHRDQVLRLVPEEPGGADQLLDVFLAVPRARARASGYRCEERRSDEIDPRVGALRREDRGHQQLVGVGVLEGAVRVRIGGLEPGQHAPRAGTAGGGGFPGHLGAPGARERQEVRRRFAC